MKRIIIPNYQYEQLLQKRSCVICKKHSLDDDGNVTDEAKAKKCIACIESNNKPNFVPKEIEEVTNG